MGRSLAIAFVASLGLLPSCAVEKVKFDRGGAEKANYKATPKALFFLESEEVPEYDMVNDLRVHFGRRLVVSTLLNTAEPRSRFFDDFAVAETPALLVVRPEWKVDLKTYASESERTGHMVLSYNGTWSTADLRNVLSQEALEELPREFPSGIGATSEGLKKQEVVRTSTRMKEFCLGKIVQREGMCVVFFFDDMSCSEPDNDKPESPKRRKKRLQRCDEFQKQEAMIYSVVDRFKFYHHIFNFLIVNAPDELLADEVGHLLDTRGMSDSDYPFMVVLQPQSLKQWISFGPVPFGTPKESRRDKEPTPPDQLLLAFLEKLDVRDEAVPKAKVASLQKPAPEAESASEGEVTNEEL